MANIQNARLAITAPHGAENANLSVSFDVTWRNAAERSAPKNVVIELWGDDPEYDDHLLSFSRSLVSDPNGSNPEHIVVSFVLPRTLLDEDGNSIWPQFGGDEDEVYAKVRLRWQTNELKTNTIVGNFE